MSSLDSSVNKCLKDMHNKSKTEKGSYGEEAVFKICEQFYQTEGGILYHSYTYKPDETKEGNIKKAEDGHLFVEALSSKTEIDILYCTKYRIYPIEVKAYRAKEIVLTDDGISGCYKTDKSPVHQNEMHCRHLYPTIFRGLPNGSTGYVIPVVCFVDKCKLIDRRSIEQKNYIYVTILSTLKQFIRKTNVPGDYLIDLQLMQKLLSEIEISHEKHLPLR